MSAPMFYEPGLDQTSKSIILNAEESFHARKVLRLKAGDEILLANGMGISAKAVISGFQKENIVAGIKKINSHILPHPNVYLAICPVKKHDKTEWVVEKATEIGVTGIFFFSSRYSERESLNFERLEKHIISAIKQSGNFFKPQLYPLVDFESFLSNCTNFAGDKFIAHCEKQGTQTALASFRKFSDVMIMIGPEGGFSKEEVAMAIKNGFRTITMGENILRAETAAIWALSVIKAFNQ